MEKSGFGINKVSLAASMEGEAARDTKSKKWGKPRMIDLLLEGKVEGRKEFTQWEKLGSGERL